MEDNLVTLKLPKPYYTLFDVERSGLPEVIVVNRSLLSFDDKGVFCWHLLISLEALDLADNEMPTPADSKELFSLADRMESLIEGENALFLSRGTWNGVREIQFRVHNPDVTDTVLKGLLAEKPDLRKWSYSIHPDPNWVEAAKVFQLFPLAEGPDA